MYIPFPRLSQALHKGEIHIHRNEAGDIVGYIWLNNLKKKPISRIEEICSTQHGLGSEMIDWAKNNAANPVLELKVVDFNENAIKFYQHRGFNEVERENGKNINNITMQWRKDYASKDLESQSVGSGD